MSGARWRRPLKVAFVRFPELWDGHPAIEVLLGSPHIGDVDTIMMCGPLPERSVVALRKWAEPDASCSPYRIVSSYTGNAKQLRITYRSDNGHRVNLYRASAWFGENVGEVGAERAWGELTRLFARRGWPMFPTPGYTGRIALANTWAETGASYPPECEDGTVTPDGQTLADLIRNTAAQGRVELFPGAALLGGDRLYKADGRFMYADLATAELGVGAPKWVEQPSDPYAFGRYHVTFGVPEHWRHVGLVGVRVPGQRRLWWPRTPGEGGTAWIDGSELMLLARYNWHFEVLEGWEWPARARPLAKWAKRLADMRGDSKGPVADAVRAVLLHTIGALHAKPRLDEHSVSDASEVPDTARDYWYDAKAERWTYRTEEGVSIPELAHPEWSAHIWARARVRLAAGTTARPFGLLHVDPATLVACELDAIYTTQSASFVDDRRVGTFRPAGDWHKPWQRFGSLRELHQYTGEGE